MNKLSTLKLIRSILTDKRNENRYFMTTIRNKKGEVTATYHDAIDLVEQMIALESSKKQGVTR